ncbi:hypothetical protein DQG23_07420 [Paenibacillus contaminans]|uniref:Uncharacterized protein n=1 Tax=Paenibacillus contaminans TaxID=450362 RepID=A0A329MQ39_9BACL|nr:hypothetical protein DQG23_07420 [Paenibacillus contaminans]
MNRYVGIVWSFAEKSDGSPAARKKTTADPEMRCSAGWHIERKGVSVVRGAAKIATHETVCRRRLPALYDCTAKRSPCVPTANQAVRTQGDLAAAIGGMQLCSSLLRKGARR